MTATESPNGEEVTTQATDRPLPEYVNWLVAALIALGGMALTVGGSVLTFVVDRTLLEEGIESGQITVVIVERDLTRTEMLEFTLEVVNWTGIGLLVTGVGLVLFAVVYLIVRHRAHQRTSAGESPDSLRSNAVLGAVTTTVLSFLPFSPVVGGGLAGYLEHSRSGRSVSVGALSGLLAMVPALSIIVFVTVGMFSGLSGIQETGLGIVAAAVLFLVSLFVATYGAGLGALGGFIGGRFAEE